MKVGILTLFHGNDNWGGTLQGVALKYLVEREYPSARVDIIDYRSKTNVIYPTIAAQAMQYTPKEFFEKGKEILLKKLHPINKLIEGRHILFEEFRKPFLTNKHIYTDIELSELGKEYDVLICGSDQIWNPNVSHPGYFLKNVGGSCRKISYAASIARDSLSDKQIKAIVPLINEFDAVSVRERTAQRILSPEIGIKKPIQEVLDPTMMIEAPLWQSILNEIQTMQNAENHLNGCGNNRSGTDDSKPYAFALFFSESCSYRKAISQYCSSKGWGLKFIPFAAKYTSGDEKGDGERLWDVGPAEFLKLVEDAQYIFTDSFHGSVFSILFRKEFLVFERDAKTKVSKNSRLYDLLEKFELSDRLVKRLDDLGNQVKEKVDHNKVYKLLETYRLSSLSFLRDAIGSETDYTSIAISDRVDCLQKEECCGCGLCSAVCPKKCISFEQDDEGFLYPKVREDDCVHCGKCLSACHNKNKVSETNASPRESKKGASNSTKPSVLSTHIGYNRDEKKRLLSSSGAIFYELAASVLRDNGVVYGAAFTEDFSVEHLRIDDECNLSKLLTSKYVQSKSFDVFSNIKADMEAGRKILFSGTPCQTAAIKEFAKRCKNSENLFLVDIVCHGVPSPGIWQSYLKNMTGDGIIKEVCFRDKSLAGWHDYRLHVEYVDRRNVTHHKRESRETNAYMRSFMSGWNIRPCCYRCEFKKSNYAGDITLGDAWGIEHVFPNWTDDKGISLIVVRSDKGIDMLESIRDRIVISDSKFESWKRYNSSIVKATCYNLCRAEIFLKYKEEDSASFWRSQSVIPIRDRFRYLAKRCLKITGLDKAVRKMT